MDEVGVFIRTPRNVAYRFNSILKAHGLYRREVLVRFMSEYTPAMARAAAEAVKAQKQAGGAAAA